MNDERFDFYANGVNVVTSIYDVTLHFSTQSPIAPVEGGKPPTVEISGTCNVRVSPQHAKSLAALLIKHIADYEKNYSLELPIPENIAKFWTQYVK